MRKIEILFLLLILTIPAQPAQAVTAVNDSVAIGKLIDQLNKMQEQITTLGEIAKKSQEQIDAIGKAGQITLPGLNVAKMASQLRQDVQCLTPDLSKLMPNLEFENVDFGSVCQAGHAYRQALWIDKKDVTGLPWNEQVEIVEEVEARRENVLSDATEKGLGLADIAAKSVEETNKAADEKAASARGATTENERLAVIAESQPVIIRALAQQTQILAQMLKIQAAFSIRAGVPVNSLLSEEDDKKKGDEQ